MRVRAFRMATIIGDTHYNTQRIELLICYKCYAIVVGLGFIFFRHLYYNNNERGKYTTDNMLAKILCLLKCINKERRRRRNTKHKTCTVKIWRSVSPRTTSSFRLHANTIVCTNSCRLWYMRQSIVKKLNCWCAENKRDLNHLCVVNHQPIIASGNISVTMAIWGDGFLFFIYFQF